MHQESNWVKLALFISELKVGGKRGFSNVMATPPKLDGGLQQSAQAAALGEEICMRVCVLFTLLLYSTSNLR